MKSLPFHHPKPEFQKRYLFWAEPPLIGQKESIPWDKRSDRNLVPSLLLASRNVHNVKCTRIGINIFRAQCEQISAIRLVQFLVETIRLGRRTELWSCVLRLLQPRPQVLLVFQYGGGRREPVFFLYFQILHETHQNTGIAARANALKCLILIIVNAFFSFWSLDRLRRTKRNTGKTQLIHWIYCFFYNNTFSVFVFGPPWL